MPCNKYAMLGAIHKGRPHERGGRGVPEKQKNVDMGEGGCLANLDVLFKMSDLVFSGPSRLMPFFW